MSHLTRTRRQATRQELAEGERQMRLAQERMEREAQEAGELPLEDQIPAGGETEGNRNEEIQNMPVEDVARPKAVEDVPRSLVTSTPVSHQPKASEVQVSPAQVTAVAVPKDPAQFQTPGPKTAAKAPTEAQHSVEAKSNGGPSTLRQSDRGRVERSFYPFARHQALYGEVTPTPEQNLPLFDEAQLRRFQELYQQAPMIYPGMIPPQFIQAPPQPASSAIAPPLQRPLFLENEEERISGGNGVSVTYPYRTQETDELRNQVRMLISENQSLRSRVEQMESKMVEDPPKFSTPESQREVPEEAARPPEAQGQEAVDLYLGQAIEGERTEVPTEEAERPPMLAPQGQPLVFGPQVLPPPVGRPKEAAGVPKAQSKEAAGVPKAQPKEVAVFSQVQPKEAARPPTSTDDPTIMVMLKLMEGMQAIQQKLVDDRHDDRGGSEVVRAVNPLPALAEWSASSGPIDFSDWLALIEPMMGDLTNTSSLWWEILVREATSWYQRHLLLPPLERVAHHPTPSAELSQPKWIRLEKRASTLLLMAIPESQREELVSSKRLTALGIICQLLVIYQPGGLGEKELILRSLETPAEAANLSEAVQSLRKWARWRRRASELHVSEPDPFLLVKGLNRIIRKPLENHRDLNFRISLARSTLQVDSNPTSTTVTSFALHLLAEFEQVCHHEVHNNSQSKKKQVEAQEKAKANKMKKIEAEEEKKDGDGSQSPGKRGKGVCKFFNSEGGCRRGKACTWSHEARDEKRRCYVCGSVEHLAPQCTRPKTAAEASASRPKIQKLEEEGFQVNEKDMKQKEESVEEEESSMKGLLEQANKMLKSLTTSSTSTSTVPTEPEGRDAVLNRLQEQLNSLKLKVLKLNHLALGNHQGLIDSGATHALRPLHPEERPQDLKVITVTLANGESTQLYLSPGGVLVSSRSDIEPIVPMGLLASELGCQLLWAGDQLQVWHPARGQLQINCQEGCPQISRKLALQLIEELEEKGAKGRLKEIVFKDEVKWMKDLVQTHPVLRSLPDQVRSKLVVDPGEWSKIPLNKRGRKRLQKTGMILHLFAGEEEGFTLRRAFQQQGGDPDLLLEIDIKRGASHNMLTDDGVYSALLRALLDDRILAIVGGPNCRSRSVLRHYPIPGCDDPPRPLREWGQYEFGLPDLTPDEAQTVYEDDLMLWRMCFLFMAGSYLRKARKVEEPIGFLLEQPASPQDYMPETVSFWGTSQWKELKSEFNLKETTYQQGHLGGQAPKPTTFGGNLELKVKKHRMKKDPGLQPVKSSKELARWSPGTMSMVSEAIITQVLQQEHPRLRPLSWDEHLRHGHIPYRRDCAVCQQAMQQQAPHRKVDQPLGGVLSLDTAGPLQKASDLGGYKARYLLVGVLTWKVPKESQRFQEPEVGQLEDGGPMLEEGAAEEQEAAEPPPLEDKEAVEPLEAEVEEAAQEQDLEEIIQPEPIDLEGEAPQPVPEEPRAHDQDLVPGGVDPEELAAAQQEMETRTFRLVAPLVSKNSKETTRETMNMILRLRADGYHVGSIHVDQGHEFYGAFRTWCRERGIHVTRTSGDDPKANGRCEVAVKSLKTQIRRVCSVLVLVHHGGRGPQDGSMKPTVL